MTLCLVWNFRWTCLAPFNDRPTLVLAPGRHSIGAAAKATDSAPADPGRSRALRISGRKLFKPFRPLPTATSLCWKYAATKSERSSVSVKAPNRSSVWVLRASSTLRWRKRAALWRSTAFPAACQAPGSEVSRPRGDARRSLRAPALGASERRRLGDGLVYHRQESGARGSSLRQRGERRKRHRRAGEFADRTTEAVRDAGTLASVRAASGWRRQGGGRRRRNAHVIAVSGASEIHHRRAQEGADERPRYPEYIALARCPHLLRH